MPPFKLTYFNGRGRAEVIRYIMAYAGFKYEDNRIDEQSEWPEFKPSETFAILNDSYLLIIKDVHFLLFFLFKLFIQHPYINHNNMIMCDYTSFRKYDKRNL